MPSDQFVNFLELVVKAGLIATTAVAVAFSTGVAVALLVTWPKRATAPAAAPARERPAVESRPVMRPTAA